MKSTVDSPLSESDTDRPTPIRTDEPAATIQRAFDKVPDCPDWDMLSESSQAQAYRIGITDERIDRLLKWRDDVENDDSTSQKTVKEARCALHAYIVSQYREVAIPESNL